MNKPAIKIGFAFLAVVVLVILLLPKTNSGINGDYSDSPPSSVIRESDTETEAVTDVESYTIISVGDSITYGSGSGDIIAGSYTSALINLLPKSCKILNFGRSGSTALSDVSPHIPYIETKEYESSLLSSPDIVILMLGTNDSWYISQKEDGEFKASLSDIIDSYLNLESKPDVFVCTPPCRFTYDDCAYQTELIIVPEIKALAEEKSLKLIDIFSITNGRENLFYDGIHPTKDGYQLIAKEVSDAVSDFLGIKE